MNDPTRGEKEPAIGPGLDPADLLDALAAGGLFRCAGVPDSTLAPLLAALAEDSRFDATTASSECEAVAIAAGQYLATGAPSWIYLQNSGLGKTVNPITTLMAPEICGIPALLVIGWRGAPDGAPDEPQHVVMGRILPGLLTEIGVAHEVLTGERDELAAALARAQHHMGERRAPYALVVRPGLLAGKHPASPPPAGAFTRKAVIASLLEALPRDTRFVATTGKAARELYFLREDRGEGHPMDFHTVGGMGCASGIGLGLASQLSRSHPGQRVCVLDGDGAALMQLGNLATIAAAAPHNLLHVVLDNGCHDSTGGQPTAAPAADLARVARALGYPSSQQVHDPTELAVALEGVLAKPELAMIVAKVAPGSDPRLGRPHESPGHNTQAFRDALRHQLTGPGV